MILPGALQAHITTKFLSVIVAGAMGLLAIGCSPGSSATTPSAIQLERSGTSYRLVNAFVIDGAQSTTSPSRLRLLSSGSANARIVDEEHNILMTAPPKGTIFSMRGSPDQEQILIYYGDATYQVVYSDSLAAIASLPVAPRGQEDATGFTWRWLDDNHLLGNASLPSTDTEGKTAAEIEGTPPRATLLYVYRLADGALTPVQLDPALPRAFMVYETSGWNVTLLSHDDELVGAKIEEVPIP